jgi:alkanesulfonate monooxygenase SsuD/methylene tetrahydromethanopterin reductase-like flavin-dependent oxidoreductase (luciferase family)
LSFVAAATRRILPGTGVLLPYHHPVVLAKRLATIDVLSKGADSAANGGGRHAAG